MINGIKIVCAALVFNAFAMSHPSSSFSEEIAITNDILQTQASDETSDTSSLLDEPPAPFCGPNSTGCEEQPGAGLGGSTGKGQTCTSTTGHAEKCWDYGKSNRGQICQCCQYLMVDGIKVTCNRSSASELQNPLWKQIIEDLRRR